MSEEITVKKCLNCGKEIHYQEWVDSLPERISKAGHNQISVFWQQKLYCTKECRIDFKSRRDVRYSKICEHCGKNFHKRGQESLPSFKKKKFCSNGCKQEYFLIERLARSIGIPHDKLKNHILKLVE